MSHFFANWNVFDCVIVGIIILSLIFGLFRGFVREIMSLVTWIAALFAAFRFSPRVSELLHSVISNDRTRDIVSVVLIFIIVMLIGFIATKLAHGFSEVSGLGFLDRLLGLVFGAARGVLLVVILLLIIQVTSYKNAAWVKQSQLAPYAQPVVTYFSTLIPDKIRNAPLTWLDRLKAIAHITQG